MDPSSVLLALNLTSDVAAASAESYQIPQLGFENGTFIFSSLRTFLSYITPNDVPVVYCVLELLRDAFNMRVSLPELVLEALKIESGFIGLMSLFIVVAAVPMGITIVWCYCQATTPANTTERYYYGGNQSSRRGQGSLWRPAQHQQQRSREDEQQPVNRRMRGSSSSTEMLPTSSSDSMNIHEDSFDREDVAADEKEQRLNCYKNLLNSCLQIVIFLWLLCTIIIFVANVQIATAVDRAPNIIRMSLKDSEFFVKDTYRHLSTNLNSRVHAISDGINGDLAEIDKLLGDPILEELSDSTQIETIFEHILNISTDNLDLVQRLNAIYKTLGQALQISGDAASRMEELQMQLSFIQSQCIAPDRALCETLRLKNFDEFEIMNSLIRLQKDEQLIRMYEWSTGRDPLDRYRERHAANEWYNLTVLLNETRERFRSIPGKTRQQVEQQRVALQQDLKQLTDISNGIIRELGSYARRAIYKIDKVWQKILPHFEELNEVSEVIWTLGLGVTSVCVLAIVLFYTGLSLGCCCESPRKAGIVLIAACVILSLIGAALAVFTTLAMLLGGHGEIFLCGPLYDSPNYYILRRLFDKPGLVFKTESEFGLVHDLLMVPGKSEESGSHGRSNAATLEDVTLEQVLNDCQDRRRSTFSVFQLGRLVNISDLYANECNTRITEHIKAVSLDWTNFTSNLTTPLQSSLERIRLESRVNLTGYRINLSEPTPVRELATFTEHLHRVSIQIRDVTTSSRMTTLGSKARRLQITVLQELERHRTELLYQLTAFDLQKSYWEATLNKSIENLKFARNFFHQHSQRIFEAKSQQFREKLESHQRRHLKMLNDTLYGGGGDGGEEGGGGDGFAGPGGLGGEGDCYPLFQIFNSNRILLCKHIMDPLNGLWFATFICIVLFSIITPMALCLAGNYKDLRRVRKRLRHSNSHQYGAPSDTVLIGEQSNWTTANSAAASRPEGVDIDRSNWSLTVLDRVESPPYETYIYFDDDERAAEILI